MEEYIYIHTHTHIYIYVESVAYKFTDPWARFRNAEIYGFGVSRNEAIAFAKSAERVVKSLVIGRTDRIRRAAVMKCHIGDGGRRRRR